MPVFQAILSYCVFINSYLTGDANAFDHNRKPFNFDAFVLKMGQIMDNRCAGAGRLLYEVEQGRLVEDI